MKKIAMTALLLTSSLSFAGEMGFIPSQTPQDMGFFVGIGGGYNTLGLKQDMSAIGNFNVFTGAGLVATGPAGGDFLPFHAVQSNFAPNVQLGYMSRFFEGSEQIWGVKYLYNYANNHTTDRALVTEDPRLLNNTALAPAGTLYRANLSIRALETTVEHEMALLAFIGQSFTHTNVYFGIGPSLFDINSQYTDVSAFVNANGTRRDLTTTFGNFSGSEWVWGGAAQVGLTYYLNPSWFVDVNYNYAVSRSFNNSFTSRFVTTGVGINDIGTYTLTNDQRAIYQGIVLTINKVFAL